MPGRNGRDPRFHTCISRRLRHLLRTDEHCEASAASRAAAELTFEHDDPVLCFSDDSDSEDRHDDQENQPPVCVVQRWRATSLTSFPGCICSFRVSRGAVPISVPIFVRH